MPVLKMTLLSINFSNLIFGRDLATEVNYYLRVTLNTVAKADGIEYVYSKPPACLEASHMKLSLFCLFQKRSHYFIIFHREKESRPGSEWLAIARARPRKRHVLARRVITAHLNFNCECGVIRYLFQSIKAAI